MSDVDLSEARESPSKEDYNKVRFIYSAFTETGAT